MVSSSQPLLHAFTVDVEEYFQVSACEHAVSRSDWAEIPSRLRIGLDRILELCEQHDTRGTFFVLGWIAERSPEIVRAIADRGHEIGCHSHEHRLVFEMTPAAFREDLDRAISAIEDACGQPVTAYRAPSFSITADSLWALEILADRGITLDSSVFPIRHDRYGVPDAPMDPYRPSPRQPQLVEFPPSTIRLLGRTLPCAGGGYLRIAPLAFTRWALRRIESERRRAVVYVHPWEFDPDQPDLPMSLGRRRRHRIGLAHTKARLRELLGEFDFGPISEVAADLPTPPPVRSLSDVASSTTPSLRTA